MNTLAPAAPPQAGAPTTLTRDRFQASIRGRQMDLYTLRNRAGMCVRISNYGARLQQILVPDRAGEAADVLLGYGSLDHVLQDGSWQGAFVGRYANRLRGARFMLDGREHLLPPNDGPNLLHGGPLGCGTQPFGVLRADANSLLLHYRFDTAGDGFPGTVDLQLGYRVAEASNTLLVEWTAQALDAPTVASFTSHGYFNLSGRPGGTVLDHSVAIHANRWLETDAQLLPTGRIPDVQGTPFDLRQPTVLQEAAARPPHPQLNRPGLYDHFWLRPGADDGTLAKLATVAHPGSGRSLEVWSTEPGLQFYAGGSLGPHPAGLPDKHGLPWRRHGGLCLEPSRYPDAPNQLDFPSARMAAGEVRTGRIEYRFGVAAG